MTLISYLAFIIGTVFDSNLKLVVETYVIPFYFPHLGLLCKLHGSEDQRVQNLSIN